jgi:hypothetical protein
MSASASSTRTFARRHLDPGDRLAEVLFGLIMVLTVTLGAGVAVKETPGAARELLIAALGCNLAWGIIDGAFYIMTSLLERGRHARLIASVRQAPDEAAALAVIGRAVDDRLAGFAEGDDWARVCRLLRDLAARNEPAPVRVEREDVMGALASGWLVVVATVPAVVPFMLIDEPYLALRVSNAVLLTLLFAAGTAWGRYAGVNRWVSGLTFLVAGIVMVGVAIALGG